MGVVREFRAEKGACKARLKAQGVKRRARGSTCRRQAVSRTIRLEEDKILNKAGLVRKAKVQQILNSLEGGR